MKASVTSAPPPSRLLRSDTHDRRYTTTLRSCSPCAALRARIVAGSRCSSGTSFRGRGVKDRAGDAVAVPRRIAPGAGESPGPLHPQVQVVLERVADGAVALE